jgi:clan AA aspartic protease
MTGRVDDYRRALVRITVSHPINAASSELNAWVDTGCTGELVLPAAQIAFLGLPRSGQCRARLGDGSVVNLDTYSCLITWLGNVKQIEIVANQGQFPLVGVGLLQDSELIVNYPARTVMIR